MAQFLHLRLGRFFNAVAGDTTAARKPWQRALGRANGIAATLEMTARMDELAHRYCAAIEWRSASEAWLDLGSGIGLSDKPGGNKEARSPWAVADELRQAAQELLPVQVACGVAATKAAARAASALAAPSGLLVVFPGYESSILTLAAKTEPAERAVNAEIDAAPFRPVHAPRAIVRSAMIAESKNLDAARSAQIEVIVARLVHDAREGLSALGLLASIVRVQFSGSVVKDEFVSLPGATSLETVLTDAALPLAQRVASAGSGRIVVSLGQLSAGPVQASLLDTSYPQHHQAIPSFIERAAVVSRQLRRLA